MCLFIASQHTLQIGRCDGCSSTGVSWSQAQEISMLAQMLSVTLKCENFNGGSN